jgi:hypothetical protein
MFVRPVFPIAVPSGVGILACFVMTATKPLSFFEVTTGLHGQKLDAATGVNNLHAGVDSGYPVHPDSFKIHANTKVKLSLTQFIHLLGSGFVSVRALARSHHNGDIHTVSANTFYEIGLGKYTDENLHLLYRPTQYFRRHQGSDRREPSGEDQQKANHGQKTATPFLWDPACQACQFHRYTLFSHGHRIWNRAPSG